MAEAIVAGAVAGAIAGAIVALAVVLLLSRRPVPRGTWTFRGQPVPSPASPSASGYASAAQAPRPSPTRSGSVGPFDRFSDGAKRVLALAQDEAVRLGHNYIGTEHLLLGLLRDPGIASRVLERNGVELSKARTAVSFIVPGNDAPSNPGEITLSPRTKKVIELAIDEARALGHAHVGPEHLLLGLVREGEGIACGVIESLGVSLEKLRRDVMAELGGGASPSA